MFNLILAHGSSLMNKVNNLLTPIIAPISTMRLFVKGRIKIFFENVAFSPEGRGDNLASS